MLLGKCVKLLLLKFRDCNKDKQLRLGMAMGRVRAGFFHTRTRSTGQDPWPGPGPFRVPGFFPRPGPAPVGPRGSRGPRLGLGPSSWPNQKKKKNLSPDLFFPYVQAQIKLDSNTINISKKHIYSLQYQQRI